jgi:hypothetical protein
MAHYPFEIKHSSRLVQSFRSVIRLGEDEVRCMKTYITNIGDDIWLGRKSFVELGWQTM